MATGRSSARIVPRARQNGSVRFEGVRLLHRSPTVRSRGLLQRYSDFLDKHPLFGNVVSSGVIGGIGDAVCQLGVEGKRLEDYDVPRFARLVATNCMLVGPGLTLWYGFLGRVTATWGSGLAATAKRVAVDQLVFAPPFIACFFTVAAALEGKLQDAPRRLQQGWLSAVIANYSLWPAAQAVNFGLVPPRFRVLFSNFVGVAWNTYLSLATASVRNKDVNTATAAPPATE